MLLPRRSVGGDTMALLVVVVAAFADLVDDTELDRDGRPVSEDTAEPPNPDLPPLAYVGLAAGVDDREDRGGALGSADDREMGAEDGDGLSGSLDDFTELARVGTMLDGVDNVREDDEEAADVAVDVPRARKEDSRGTGIEDGRVRGTVVEDDDPKAYEGALGRLDTGFDLEDDDEDDDETRFGLVSRDGGGGDDAMKLSSVWQEISEYCDSESKLAVSSKSRVFTTVGLGGNMSVSTSTRDRRRSMVEMDTRDAPSRSASRMSLSSLVSCPSAMTSGGTENPSSSSWSSESSRSSTSMN
ncbi:hypothetical protein DYB31_016135 [Aphanomyces astaci]|uniref:Uncharacterized protein n=1 Tax=Aphanomyces astaci TaxID=112090 RepID=A0A397F382_APHAT|nr:hypothetical protein DYB31_016135 [Aphanomyces astaci]